MSKIIALVDGSVYSESVCDHAAWVATRKGSSVEILHVLGRREAGSKNLSGNIGLGARSKLMEELADLDAQKAKLNIQRGRAILEDAEARVRADGVSEVQTRLRHGDLMDELHSAEQDSDLVVIGKRGEAADFAKLHLGSNVERAIRTSKKPVLVTSRAFRPVKTFMIAFEGGASSIKAVEHVAQSKVFAGLACKLIFAGPDTSANRATLAGGKAILAKAGYDVDAQIHDERPDVAIHEAIETLSIDMLLMGAFSHSRIRSLFIGSTTTEMVRSCLVPLLMFR
ncbi:universal stress protein [Falsihalocynthiibacter arcticus]|uniref:Universal stress protein UspA n=1 Tax=Falsihalocynthiibacter arcticus TaxID=1579316 RepID=A0A126UXB0_9RHOB|nr:universal stress protein [Falsihalocynthiibacter arcticus]AML50674.1 universal stress protein UspA [Falsihalocynthiibacter arcticus]